ncbi:MAG: response regulator [Magnetococcus sp. XQGC-1]
MANHASPPPEPARKPTVLIVDDVPGNLKVLAALLGSDYQVVVAISGQEALRLVAAAPPDIIILDIIMPKMDGYAVCAQLQAQQATREIPIIFITVKSDPEDETRGLALGAVDFITKPFSPSVVLARVKTHLALREARQQAMQAAQAKSLFLAHMSHEIRTPLNGIVGFADLLANRHLDDKSRQFLTIIQRSAQHLLAVTNDILDFTRIEADRVSLENIPFNLEQLLAETVELFALAAQEKGITLAWHAAADLPGAIDGDPSRLRQVLYNLLANAIKFTRQGRVDLEVSRLEAPPPSILLQFAVRDTGIGIAAAAMERLFQPFMQADASTTRRFGGTGLGLAICARLVQRMQGEITVQSEPGVGSCFQFTLPSLPSTRPATAPSPAQGKPASQPFAHAGYRVLVVDDVETNRVLLSETLTLLGINSCALAGNGQEALERLQAQPFDLVLMDCQMPVMDGLHATRLLRQMEAMAGKNLRTPVVALTASATTEDREQCLGSGMDDLLPKPLTLHALAGLLQRLLQGISPITPTPDRDSPEPTTPLPPPLDNEAFAEKKQRLGEKRMANIIDAFLRDMSHNMASLHAAVQTGDVAELMQVAHAFKGCCGVVHAGGMAQRCQELESIGKAGTTQGASERLEQLTQEATRIRHFLEQERERAIGYAAQEPT